MGPDVRGRPTNQPLTTGPQRRPARLTNPSIVGVKSSLNTNIRVYPFYQNLRLFPPCIRSGMKMTNSGMNPSQTLIICSSFSISRAPFFLFFSGRRSLLLKKASLEYKSPIALALTPALNWLIYYGITFGVVLIGLAIAAAIGFVHYRVSFSAQSNSS